MINLWAQLWHFLPYAKHTAPLMFSYFQCRSLMAAGFYHPAQCSLLCSFKRCVLSDSPRWLPSIRFTLTRKFVKKHWVPGALFQSESSWPLLTFNLQLAKFHSPSNLCSQLFRFGSPQTQFPCGFSASSWLFSTHLWSGSEPSNFSRKATFSPMPW